MPGPPSAGTSLRSLWSRIQKDPTAGPNDQANPAHPQKPAAVALPLTLSGSSAKEGEVVAQSGNHPELHHHGHTPPTRREVVCFDCRAVSKASSKASSTQCSNCGTFIDLRDVEIKGRSTQRIRTRGNVTVHKKGALLGTAVHCGNLIVDGTVAGSIYAQGTVQFRTSTKVLGEIRCRHLVIDRKVHIAGLQPVHVESLDLEGELNARVFATGTAHIRRHGRLSGGLWARWLRVDPGGEVTGSVSMGTPRLPARETGGEDPDSLSTD